MREIPYLPTFSHIYVEKDALHYSLTKKILERKAEATVVPIHHYKDVFDRGGQDPRAQALSPALILAVRREPFLYPGSDNCQAFGADRSYYALPAMGCPFGCVYCFLRGMYPSAAVVVFVNIDDLDRELQALAAEGPAPVSLSYETDLAAIEPITGLLSFFAKEAEALPALTLDIRTKAAPISAIRAFNFQSSRRLVFSFTLSPDPVIDRFEAGTPNLAARLTAVKAAADAGFPGRLCFDPMIAFPGWREVYAAFFERIAKEVDFSRIRDISIGSFRIPKDYLKNMKKAYGRNEISTFPYRLESGTYTYGQQTEEAMKALALSALTRVFPRERIFTD